MAEDGLVWDRFAISTMLRNKFAQMNTTIQYFLTAKGYSNFIKVRLQIAAKI
jgi:hypothetical protein